MLSWATIESLSLRHPEIVGIDLMRNYGQHNALLAGIRAARHAVVVTMDDDLQNPPEEIPKLLAKLAEGYDVVYGTPASRQHGFFRDLASQITKLTLQNAMGADTARKISAFRAFRLELRDETGALQFEQDSCRPQSVGGHEILMAVGAREAEGGTVSLRRRDGAQSVLSIAEAAASLRAEAFR